MRAIIFVIPFLGLFLFLNSCTDVERTIDDELKFSINTAYNSRGLSSFRMPASNELHLIPQDPLNPLTPEKVKLGQLLFHESGFATVGEFADMAKTYSCASCHHAAGGFQANVPQGIGEGGIGFGMSGEGRQIDLFVEMSKIDVQPLRTPSAMNAAYQTNMLWNGQFGATGVNMGTESVWPEEGPISNNNLGFEGVEIQAIAGLDVHRHLIDAASVSELGYQEMFDAAFSDFNPEERYSNITAGLAIAAYERTIMSNQSPFQRWLRGSNMSMTDLQKEGAMLFFGKANCNACHNGPSLASMEFHAIGLNDFDPSMVVDFDPLDEANKGRGSFTKNSEDDYKFKVPQLYNLKDSPFYGHGASFTSVKEIIEYKNQGIAQNSSVPRSHLATTFEPLNLSEEEINALTDFVVNALYDPNLERYEPQSLPSNFCFPNNDWKSQEDLGCN